MHYVLHIVCFRKVTHQELTNESGRFKWYVICVACMVLVITILFNSAINCIYNILWVAMDSKTPRPDEKQESKIVGDVLCYYMMNSTHALDSSYWHASD